MSKKRITLDAGTEAAEDRLPEELERLRQLVDETSDWIWEVGPDLCYTYSSAQSRAILGYDPSEVIGRSPFDLMPPEEAARVRALVDPVIAARQPIVSFESAALHRDGRRVALETSGKPVFDDAGAWRGYIGVSRDITRRHQVEEALRESQRRLATLMDNLQGMAYRCRNDSQWTMEFVSVGSLALTGCPPEDLIRNRKLSYNDLIHPEDRGAVWAEVQKALKRKEPFRMTYRIVSPQGVEKWVWEQGQGVFGEGGEVQALEGFIMDITDRIRAEQERVRAESQIRRLTQLESLSVLAGGVAHEYNNLLTAILGNAEVALAKLPAESPVRNNMDLVCRAAMRASELSRQMMAYSGQGGLSVGEVDLNEVIVDAAHQFERVVSAGCRLEYRVQDRLPRLRADTAQVRQALVNLVVNASEALGGEGGVVTLGAGVEDLRREDFAAMVLDEGQVDGRYVFVEVGDNGPGIDATTRQRIFDPFYSTKFAGRGLGLSAVLGIVRGHRGAIRVTSEPGKGCTFRLYFPCAP